MKFYKVLILFCLIVAACSPEDKPGKTDPVNPDPQKDTTDTTAQKKAYKDVTLLPAFTEDFSKKTSAVFEFATKERDFRYFMAFPSWYDSKKKLLLVRVDPSDPSGMSQCPKFTSREHTFYGSYSIRLRLPDTKAAQPNLGLNALFTVTEQDEKYGFSTIEMLWKIADPTILYLNTIADCERNGDRLKDPVSSYKPSGAFYECGFDWHSDKVQYWIKVSSEKVVVKEFTQYVPEFPSMLSFVVYHSKNNPVESNSKAIQKPYYPYEFEISKISYTPFEDEIAAWRENLPK